MARQYLDDAFGPDGVRVSIAIEPAVDQFVRVRGKLSGPLPLPGLGGLARRRDELLQRVAFDGAWMVDIESDTGDRVRIRRPDRYSALALAKATWHDVTERGVAALDGVR